MDSPNGKIEVSRERLASLLDNLETRADLIPLSPLERESLEQLAVAVLAGEEIAFSREILEGWHIQWQNQLSDEKEVGLLPQAQEALERENPTNRQGRGAIVVCGDPIGSRIIALLLQDSGYQARYLLSTASLNETGVLEDVQLLLLTPTPELSPERCNALVRVLKDIRGAAELTVVELVTPAAEEGIEEEGENDEAWYKVPWPCMFGELERRITEILYAKAR